MTVACARMLALATCLAFSTARIATGQTGMTAPLARPAAPADSIPAYPLLTLAQAVDRALAVNPNVAFTIGNVITARSLRRVAFGAYLPTLAFTSAATRIATSSAASAGTSAVPTTTTSSTETILRNETVGLAAAIDLFTGGRRAADVAFARAELGAARASLVSARYNAAFLAQSAFYEVMRATEIVGIARTGLAEAEKLLRYTQDMFRVGTVMRSDVLRAQLQVTMMRQQLVATNDTLAADAYALGWLTGVNGPAGVVVDSAARAIRPLALEDSVIVRLAADASPTVAAAEATLAAGRAALRAARTEYVPTISATGGYIWATNPNVVTGGARAGLTLSVGTTYPLFTGFQRQDSVIRAEVVADVARVTAADTRRSARANAALLLGTLRTAEAGIALGAEAVLSASEDLRVQVARYRAGISTMLDVLTSEVALVQAEYSLAFARNRYHTTRAALEALVGRPL